MKSVMRWRHYCDHCKKSTGTKPAMVKHEKGCTLNPARTCNMCLLQGEVQLPMQELQLAYGKGFNTLREACHHCPACILATQRQFWIDRAPDEGFGWDHPANTEQGEWDFKNAVKEFWRIHNENHGYHPDGGF
jgi:hypothetical protein